MSDDIINDVATYYTNKLRTHGETPSGVDWNGEAGQILRFSQLCRVINPHPGFCICDVGCGYGAMYDYVASNYQDFHFFGVDVSADMVAAATTRYQHTSNATFIHADRPPQPVSYCVASGIFNVRLNHDDSTWWSYLITTLDMMHATSTHGFAFNCLTSYSDRDKMRDYLYYANPLAIFDHCKTHYAKDVALLHDYGLYEFTILVRKQR
jgi:SAM-dependent methyltransferase